MAIERPRRHFFKKSREGVADARGAVNTSKAIDEIYFWGLEKRAHRVEAIQKLSAIKDAAVVQKIEYLGLSSFAARQAVEVLREIGTAEACASMERIIDTRRLRSAGVIAAALHAWVDCKEKSVDWPYMNDIAHDASVVWRLSQLIRHSSLEERAALHRAFTRVRAAGFWPREEQSFISAWSIAVDMSKQPQHAGKPSHRTVPPRSFRSSGYYLD